MGASMDILLVEDNPGDVRLMQEAFREVNSVKIVGVATDGVEALDYLRRRGKFTDAHRPDLILLDLNLPRKDGREVLAELKTDPMLRRIPIVVLTVSQAEQDIIRTYELHANCYISKPINLDDFIDIASAIQHFWTDIAKLPANINSY